MQQSIRNHPTNGSRADQFEQLTQRVPAFECSLKLRFGSTVLHLVADGVGLSKKGESHLKPEDTADFIRMFDWCLGMTSVDRT